MTRTHVDSTSPTVATGALGGLQGNLPARLWSHEETAAFLCLPTATLHQLNYKGTGPRSFKVGRHRRYDPRDVLAWLAARASDRDRSA